LFAGGDRRETRASASSTLQAELERALGFGEADLVANRAGRMTRRQAVLVAMRAAAQLLLSAYVVILFWVVFLVSLGSEVRYPNGQVAVFMTVAFFAVAGWFKLGSVRRSLSAGAVARYEGPMSVIQEGVQMARGYSVAHILLAGGERYAVPFAVYRVFEDGEEYRAFFIPDSKVVIAIEAPDRFGQSARLRHHHRWGRLDVHLWWLFLLVGSAAVLVAGLLLGSLGVALLGLGNVLLSGVAARAFVRGL